MCMQFKITFDLVERLRRESIGDPRWDPRSGAYEYHCHSAKVVAVPTQSEALDHDLVALRALESWQGVTAQVPAQPPSKFDSGTLAHSGMPR
jgi:hypothetical protein